MVRPPVNPASPVMAEQLYTVVLGNHWRVHFTSDRHAQAFAAEAQRMLNDQLFAVNVLLCEAFEAYRMAWPCFAHERGQDKALRDADARAGEHVRSAWDLLDKAITHTSGENGPFRAWQYVSGAAGHVRSVALELADLYRRRSDGVQRMRMDLLVQQANAVLELLKDYGSDVTTAARVTPSPYG